MARRSRPARPQQRVAGAAAALCAGAEPNQRVWLFLRERFLSHRLFGSYDAIVDACCQAWNRLTPERLRSLCNYPYIQQVNV